MAQWVRLASLSIRYPASGEDYVARALASACAAIDLASKDKPDLILLPELYTTAGWSGKPWGAQAETVPGRITDFFAKKAKRYGTYIFCPLLQKEGPRFYNSLVLLDRKGEIAGVYHKMHPVICEIRQGIVPGTRPGVFDTDFGRIGCAICYDLNFPDVAEGLARSKVRLVSFSSMYRGGLQLQIWAFTYGFYILSSVPSEKGVLVDPLGRVHARYMDNQNSILSMKVNLDSLLLHLDYNEFKLARLKEKYKDLVEIDASEPERRFLLISHHPTKSAWDFKREFHLETQHDFFRRAERFRKRGLSGEYVRGRISRATKSFK